MVLERLHLQHKLPGRGAAAVAMSEANLKYFSNR